ncbi:DNA (cytosine-5)-methyltransferase 3B [Frankliniella fusca]|uniref:DNA (cytosine-5-)-methyltransferase n=1 Tax=Frankliniella fusca TaxID=407009 RepID=A0AAE1GVX8_9NEOP|nr:DNA (cytosine-5)-methyltransferase 3B [Frankliniella fusca]KAK3925516.1 DNA (cytosine-5)-methyltransferase 3B [Frankliniella fusca]KAK3931881.1 DNA (cytosine-5)-methyltransferase 3B [Frankliniella fusca]
MPKYKRRGVRRYLTQAPKSKRHYGQKKVLRKGCNRMTTQAPSLVHDNNNLSQAVDENVIDGFQNCFDNIIDQTPGSTQRQVAGQSLKQTAGLAIEEPFYGFQSGVLLPGSHCRPIIVLSLYDGVSSGLVALNKLGIPVLRYFSSEICENALRVQSLRHPNVIRLGDVKDITSEVLDSLGKIDLVLAGSPCSDLSRVNPRRAGLRGGTGLLYFEFVRIIRYLQDKYTKENHSVKWLFENTCHLDKDTLLQMNSDMGVPSKRCSSSFLPVTRKRFFWGNIAGLQHDTVVRKSKLTLQDCIDGNKTAIISEARTLTSNRSGQRCVEYEGKREFFSPTDYERLQGLEAHYTDANLSITARIKLLAKGWCIPVIVDILSSLVPIFSHS